MGITHLSQICTLVLLIGFHFELTESSGNETLTDDFRSPRVSGRIVKLYSGPRPEPVYCSHEGFQPDPANCAVFYRCVRGANNKYTVFRFQCGPGTVYDPDTEVCNFPTSTKRTECGGMASGSAEKHTENEIDSLQSEFPSPINARPVYDQLDQSNTIFSTSVPQKTQHSTSAPFWMPTGIQQPHQEKPKPSQSSRQEGAQCTQDGFMGDTENCRKFYRCVGNQRGGFIRYEFSCSESTIWDDDAQSCNHPWAVQRRRCGKGNTDSDSNISNTEQRPNKYTHNSVQQQLQISYGDKVSQTQTQIAHGPVTQNQTQINYPDSDHKDQDKNVKQNQTQISYGSALSQSQTQISHANNGHQTQLQIDHSKDSSQYQSQIYETTSKTTTTQGTVQLDEMDSGYNSQPSVTQNSEDKDKGNECTSSGFMGDKNNCKKFYRCVDNGKGGFTKYDFSCGEGTVWDTSIDACNHAWAVKECGGKDPQNLPNSPEMTTTSTSTEKHSTDLSRPEEEMEPGYGDQNEPTYSPTTTNVPKPIASTESSSNNECHSSGFMGDSTDCKKFYRCVDNGRGGFTKYEFKCGEGTVWDSEIEACNHVWAVKKCGGFNNEHKETTTSSKPSTIVDDNEHITETEASQSTQGSETTQSTSNNQSMGKKCTKEGFMGDNEDCKKFYRCVDNGRGGFIKYEFSCGDGTVWDSEINACNHPPANRKCSSSSAEESASETSPAENDELQNIDSTTTTQSTFTESEKPNTSVHDKCQNEGFFGDSNNCKKFYRCVDNGKNGFTKYEFNCGEGTVWDQEIQSCNHESSNPNCPQNSGSTSNTSESQSNTTENPSSTSSSITDHSSEQTDVSSSQSSDTCTLEGFYANSQNCKKFYRCVDNGKGGFTKYDFSCGDGTVWVQEIQACDHDDGGNNCSAQVASSTEQSQYSTSSSESYTTGDNYTSQNPPKENDEYPNEVNPENSSTSEDKDCNEEGFHANKNDCKRFYRCVDDGKGGYTKYEFTCGEGTAWDSNLQTCNHINEVKSCQQSSQQNNESQNVQDDETPQSSSSTTSTSTSKPAAETKPANNDTCEKEGYFGNSQDCTKFYRCVDNGKGGLTKYDFDCGEGTIWDQDVTTCNHPQDVKNPSCNQDNSNGSASASETENSESTDSSTSTSSTTETSAGSSDCSGTTKKPSKNNVNCTKEGYYGDPNDCKKFYRCVDWDGDGQKFSVFHFECGEGTIWDPALDTCNHEDSVYPPRDCSGSGQAQTETVEEDTTTTESSKTTESTGTTEQSSTDSTTTQESSNSEQTTTEQSTSSEQTTQQSTTNAQSTQQTTEQTTEQTTTQQTTTQQTTEQTTTQQSTEQTTESTTTQQTIEQTTTQQSTEQTTSQQTTTQQTTEQSTTQESTTSEQTTTEQTTEHQTTHESQTTESNTQENTEATTSHDSTTEQSTNQPEDTESSTNDSSTTESESESTTESNPSSNCPETEDDQNLFVCPTSFRRHPKYCNMFYQCSEEEDTHDVHIATFRCPNNTIYDESKVKCVDEKEADKKCEGEIAQRRRVKRGDTIQKEPIVVTNERLKCPAAGHYPFEKEECSTVFLKCQKTRYGTVRGFVYQCPPNHVYWAVSRRCESKSLMKGCKQSYNNWNGRWEIPMERRNVAPK